MVSARCSDGLNACVAGVEVSSDGGVEGGVTGWETGVSRDDSRRVETGSAEDSALL